MKYALMIWIATAGGEMVADRAVPMDECLRDVIELTQVMAQVRPDGAYLSKVHEGYDVRIDGAYCRDVDQTAELNK